MFPPRVSDAATRRQVQVSPRIWAQGQGHMNKPRGGGCPPPLETSDTDASPARVSSTGSWPSGGPWLLQSTQAIGHMDSREGTEGRSAVGTGARAALDREEPGPEGGRAQGSPRFTASRIRAQTLAENCKITNNKTASNSITMVYAASTRPWMLQGIQRRRAEQARVRFRAVSSAEASSAFGVHRDPEQPLVGQRDRRLCFLVCTVL